MITAAEELGTKAIPLFQHYLESHPEDIAAHGLLSELRAEAGEDSSFADSYLAALDQLPGHRGLLFAYWHALTRASKLAQALQSMDAHRALFGRDRDFLLLELTIANHAGLLDRARALSGSLDDSPDALLARGQFHLQCGETGQAAGLLERVVQVQADNYAAWSLLELAWRLTGDARHTWLVGQPGLHGAEKLPLGAAQIHDIATALDALHTSSSQPIGQSVRGGTQTPGQLFLRPEPQIQSLTAALGQAVGSFLGALPPRDPSHPLLKHRGSALTFGPSWSVRLKQGGFHTAHFHPGGVLSSACYIALPDPLMDDGSMPGWLEIGRPPVELGLDLPPLAKYEPEPGLLVLFPSFLFHGTRPFSNGTRLTVAFDLVPARVRP